MAKSAEQIHEGTRLRLWLKGNGYKMEDVWKALGYESRTGLTYQLGKASLSKDFIHLIEHTLNIDLTAVLRSDDKTSPHINMVYNNLHIINNESHKNISQNSLDNDIKSMLTLFSQPEIISMLGVLPSLSDDNHWMTFAESIDGNVELSPPISSIIKLSLQKGEHMRIDPRRLYRIPDTKATITIIAYENNNAPFIEKSDKLCIKEIPHAEVKHKFGQYFYVKFKNGDSAVHIIKKHPSKEHWNLCNLNEAYDDDEVLIEDIDQVYRVHYVLKKAAQD